MDTLQTAGQTGAPETFDSVNPATSEVIATFPVFGQAEVDATVERAQEAAAWWAGLDWKQRQARLLAWKSHLTRYIGRLAELVHTETGKPLDDAKLGARRSGGEREGQCSGGNGPGCEHEIPQRRD